MTLLEASKLIPQSGHLTYDLSKPILNLDASYSPATPQGLFTVVVECVASNGFAVGVIPTSTVTSEILADAQSGAYDHLLAECSK
ncbi:MAG TPA: hypothetical protein VFU07_09165 [Candidatus Lumbricidophila sp.]|nr:hypothetical protein [Candidatus Lumbricidophila sp.]